MEGEHTAVCYWLSFKQNTRQLLFQELFCVRDTHYPAAQTGVVKAGQRVSRIHRGPQR